MPCTASPGLPVTAAKVVAPNRVMLSGVASAETTPGSCSTKADS